jgi:hypothetical protein
MILFGIGTTRAHIFPRGAGILFIVSGALTLASIPVSLNVISLAANIVFFAALAWSSVLLLQPEQTTEQVSTLDSAVAGGTMQRASALSE